ncbi:undecaprenyl-diphosphatase [Balneicella halophila]|uniref:Undecaprenyl-diphosphatase n=1 Tax=Balneicella halophila TaxID=1537566 RepID=A0A7L4UQY2_BALHA|nr:undecaprenyl-diphosphate phosphatase [Balneicella halophila]PVX52185.1 undecaprenyl-diphosphatase [Balneicella halophila]
MYEIFKALIIGIVQGLTEFLPVSSSGHIELFKVMLGLDLEGDQNLLFTLTLHTATALSTLVVFRKEVGEILVGLVKGKNEAIDFTLKIIVSMIPAALVGYFMKDTIEKLFSGNILLVGCMLLLTALLLLLAGRAKKTKKDIGFIDSFIIGLSQAVAILPGVSRSGATIATSVILGNDRSKTAMFSFLMVIPLIFGAMAKDLLDADTLHFSNEMLSSLSAGFIGAFIFGIIACRWMVALVRNAKLWYFSIYCAIIGTIAVVYTLF